MTTLTMSSGALLQPVGDFLHVDRDYSDFIFASISEGVDFGED